MNRLVLTIGKYHIAVLVIGILLMSGGSYLFLLGPKFSSIGGVTKGELIAKQESVAQKQVELSGLQDLQDQLAALSSAEIQRMDSVLPKSEDVDSLYLQFADIASELGLTLTSLKFEDAGSLSAESAKGSTNVPTIRVLRVTFGVDGVDSYERVKQLLTVLQDHIRVMDMNTLSYDPSGTGYTLTLNVYALAGEKSAPAADDGLIPAEESLSNDELLTP
ncbi:MAG: hypothetical protein HYV34_02255 [Candidatus Kerfeldbacteria bacterium]|nr:hypothetical protein [Candidatus Kerfeldbacteria bacterium]